MHKFAVRKLKKGISAQEPRERLEEASLQILETIAQALDARILYMAGHSNRTSFHATAIAKKMELPLKQVEIIRIGAQIHDIGKIGIPDAVLQKPEKLTSEEYDLIKLHPQIGKRILGRIGRCQDYLSIVELHHENYDGTGYPYGLKGDQIPLEARIVHLADYYDAITNDRAYHKLISEERALGLLMESSGTLFDPSDVESFSAVLRERKDRLKA